MFLKQFSLIIFIILIKISSVRAEEQKTRILFLYDCSQSMFGRWSGKTKMETANRLLSELMDTLKQSKTNGNLELALRVYGHQYPVTSVHRSCVDTKLEVPFSANNFDIIKKKLKSLYPRGTTPIAYSLEQAAGDFEYCSDCRNVIILITDGVEECDGDPCAVSLALQRKKIILKPFVIGLGLDIDIADAFKCVGRFYEAKDEKSFQNVLKVVMSQAIGNTSVEVDLFDKYGNPTETNVNMTFYNHNDRNIEYNYIHTMNAEKKPDTLPINPVIKYDITVHTIPPVTKKNIKIKAGKHNIIPISTPQGSITIDMIGKHEYNNLQSLVKISGTSKIINVQSVDNTIKYIVGNYDIEVLTLPITTIKNIKVNQSKTTNIQIPQPGNLNLSSIPSGGITTILIKKANQLENIYNIPITSNIRSLTLQPGNYVIIHRDLNAKKVEFCRQKSFRITSGKITTIKL